MTKKNEVKTVSIPSFTDRDGAVYEVHRADWDGTPIVGLYVADNDDYRFVNFHKDDVESIINILREGAAQ